MLEARSQAKKARMQHACFGEKELDADRKLNIVPTYMHIYIYIYMNVYMF